MALADDLKTYCKTSEDLSEFLEAAEIYLANAGIPEDETNALYRLAVKILVSHWYDNRQAVVIGTISKNIEYSLQNIIAQLKYTGVS